jgi:uncharacterized protein (TIGR03437 family)
MRSVLVSLVVLSSGLSLAADDFTTGQAARALIGQKNFTDGAYGASDVLLGGISGLAYANNTLFVADSNRIGSSPVNNRVLIYNGIQQMVPNPAAQLYYTQRCPICVGQATYVLGQADFTTTDYSLSQTGLRLPTAVATDGQHLVVADTDNNRVLIWNSIPAGNNVPADVVVGQSDFKTAKMPVLGSNTPTNWSLRGPQGVWIQNGKLYVADTQNHRVLIWNSIPTQNKAPANVVLGQPNFETATQPDLTQAKVDANATNMLNPVAVSSDGVRLFVTDLGHHRVLVWNSIPGQNQAPADIALGQPDLTSAISNNVVALCESTGTDTDGNLLYPSVCKATLSFPRFALSDGKRLFIADGGNDRVVMFQNMPTASGATPDVFLGQIDPKINIASDASDSLRAPMSLAWDGTNLYVSDAYNRRIMIYSMGQTTLPYTAVRNSASREVYAVGSVAFSGTIAKDQEITVTIGTGDEDTDKEYIYKTLEKDTFTTIITAVTDLINADSGDPNVFATPNPALDAVILTARTPGEPGNSVTLTAAVSTDATIVATASGANLTGGMDAARIAPGTLVSILGDNLAEETVTVSPDVKEYPADLGNVQVYVDGIRVPLQFVSPSQINAQIPYEINDATSLNAYVRTQRHDGSVTVTTPVAISVVGQNPGIFARDGTDPRQAVAVHYSSNATGTVSVDGSAFAGDKATVKIGEAANQRSYTYTVMEGDDLAKIRDSLIALINTDPEVMAFPSGIFTRIRLKARVAGPLGNGIPIAVETSTDAQVILTPTGSGLCCASEAGALVTEENPAVPGETIVVYSTGLGLLKDFTGLNTGVKYDGPGSEPTEFVSSLAGGKTANVLYAGMKQGDVGIYEVHLELNSSLPTNPVTQVTIAQSVYVSNIVTIPVYNPSPSE